MVRTQIGLLRKRNCRTMREKLRKKKYLDKLDSKFKTLTMKNNGGESLCSYIRKTRHLFNKKNLVDVNFLT